MEDGGPRIEEIEDVDELFTILSYICGFAIADYVPWLEIFYSDGHKKFITNAINNIGKYHESEITKRVEMWERGVRDTKEDILDVLIKLKLDSESKPLLSIEEIKAQVRDIIITAIDHPSNAAEWAVAEMMNQLDIFDRARKELDQVVGEDRLVQESNLLELNYVKACIKESLRLHPASPFNLPHV